MAGALEELFKDKMEECTKQGIEQGIEQGMERGLERGLKRGEDRFAVLAEKLIRESRTDDLLKATSSPEYRKKLYKEYGIQ